MNKFFTLLFLGTLSVTANAQTTPSTQPYGKIDQADLEMKACDFEKDANAEVLFDKGIVYFDSNYNVIVDRHKRIKIFNDRGKDHANIRIEYYRGDHSEYIHNIQAETINVTDGKVVITKIDKKLIYFQTIDKLKSAVVFSFPDVKPGSIIEFKYTQENASISDFPDWYFQSDLPTRYSEFSCTIPDILQYKNLIRVNQPFVKNVTDNNGKPTDIALANIPSLSDEPFMSSRYDNLQCILYQLISITSNYTFTHTYSDTWEKVGQNAADFDDFGGQFNKKLNGEEIIIAKAKSLKTTDEKIAYVFGEVKNAMKWDANYTRYSNDGIAKAWENKTGNSTEINLMIYHLLTKAGVKAYPLLLSTRKNGKVNPAYPTLYQFNTMSTYVPVDSANYYVLDATSKYNSYKEIPSNLLNAFGLQIDKDNKKYDLVFISKTMPVRNVVMVNADIIPSGKMEGIAQISSFSNNRSYCIKNYKENGEKKYIDYLRDDDNNLKVMSLKLENMDVDTLPLTQTVAFNLDLTGSDDNYIYFKPNIFTSIGANPFLNEKRVTDIDFGYCNNYFIVGSYKIPTGYKSDALPKSVSMIMPDQSIVFKRVVAEQDNIIMIRYLIDYKKSIFFKEDYVSLRDFYKKMYELMNEQIILKKS
ncbi:MAG: hypothetical protein JWR54_3381 [Mucilaginibacter sp.]|nr:hypothetical protein [Mucilaginibacter sp.]